MITPSLPLLLTAALSAGSSSAPVTDYDDDTYAWAGQAGDWQARAFEQDYAARPGNGCLSGTGNQTILLEGGGTLTMSLSDGECPIRDGTASRDVADAYITNGDTLSLRFSPPIHGFYSYYSSLASGAQVSVTLLDSTDQVITTLERPENPGSDFRVGHGFVSETPVSEMIFDSTEAGPTLLGAFSDLASGDSLSATDLVTFEDLGFNCPARPEYGGARCDFAYSYGLTPFEELAPDGASPRYNGAVAMDADTLIITEQGNLVDVYDRQGTSWVASASPILMPSAGGIVVGSLFGNSLAVDGNRVLVGSSTLLQADLFERQPGGEFVQNESFAAALSLPENNEFGTDVALRGDLAAVSAPLLVAPGAKGRPFSLVYFFERQPSGQWQQIDRVSLFIEELSVPSNPFSSRQTFAGQLAFSADDELLVSAFDDTSTNGFGEVQVFRNNGVAWGREQTLRASEPDSQVFGGRLAARDDLVVVADPLAKRVYLFERNEFGDWQAAQTLKAADEDEVDVFGLSLALDGERLVIGAAKEPGPVPASLYLFEQTNSGLWLQTEKVAPRDRGQGRPGLGFARAVAASGGAVVSPSSPQGAYLFQVEASTPPESEPIFSNGFEL